MIRTKSLLQLTMKGALVGAVAVAVVAVACATPRPPQELLAARNSYARAAAGPAAQMDPAGLDTAREQLREAEGAFKRDPYGYDVKHEAYLADRKAIFADANARAKLAEVQEDKARDELHEIARLQKVQLRETRETLSDAQELARQRAEQLESEKQRGLSASQELEEAEQRLEMELQARIAAEAKEAEARKMLDDLAKSNATVKEDERGVVITLSGQVLFPSGKATLLPASREALDNVAEALKANEGRNVVVEGHTDSIGSSDFNLELSQRRADAVRIYLLERGVDSDLMTSIGHGEERPVADNNSAEGRANNRRVEIVLSPMEPK